MARLGRAQRARAFIAGPNLPLTVRAGQVTGTGGGQGALSVQPVLNLVNDPTFSGTTNSWGTSGFSLVSGASNLGGGTNGLFSAPDVDQGLNYSPAGNLTTFTAGVRYYAEIKLAQTVQSVPVEVVLGSTSDDYVSATITPTGSFQTVRLSWVPQADRSATDHGLAVRVKASSAFGAILIDDAIIATSDGFWSGWRVGGKAAQSAITGTGGGTGTPGVTKATTGALTGAGGGNGTLSVRKNGTSTTTATAGGSSALTRTGAHTGTVTGTAGGGGTLSIASSNTYLPPGTMIGGGGRTGRSHTGHQIFNQGIGALSQGVFARSGTLTGSGGGNGALTAAKGGVGAATGTLGGTGAFAISKGGRGAVTATGGGSMVTAGAQTPSTGGIVATFLMGGGGRVGRSHPAAGILPAGRVPLGASSPDNRAGTLAGSGGGAAALAVRKGGVASTLIAIPAPPPVFVQVLQVAGLQGTGGGSFAYAYTRSATRVGSIVATAGGTGTFTATKKVSGALTGTGGGNPTLTVRRGAAGALAGTGGGSFTYSYVTFTAASGRLAASGGGTGTFTATKKAAASLTGTGGGSSTPAVRKGARGSTTGTGGGSLTYSYTRGGLAASGTVTGTGGGTGTLTAGKNVRFVSIAGAVGGSGFFTAAKGATVTLAGHGGGNGTFTRATSTASTLPGRVNPRRRREGHVSEAELELPLILRR